MQLGELHQTMGSKKEIQGVALVRDGQPWCSMLKNMIWGGLGIRFSFSEAAPTPNHTAGLFLLKSILSWRCLTVWLVLTFQFKVVIARSCSYLLWWLSLTFDLDLAFTELWLPSNFVSGVSLCNSGTQSPLSVVFALCSWNSSSHSVCFSILRCGQIQWWLLSGIYIDERSGSCEKKNNCHLFF